MKETQSFGMTEFQVMQWAAARGIYENGTALGQAKKTVEEAGELLAAVAANDFAEIADAGNVDPRDTHVLHANDSKLHVLQ